MLEMCPSEGLDARGVPILRVAATSVRTSLGDSLRHVYARMRGLRVEVREPLYLLRLGGARGSPKNRGDFNGGYA